MSDLIRQLTNDLQNKINSFESRFEVRDIGKVLEAGDGIAIVQGLDGVHSQELVQFENGVMGIAFSLERDQVGNHYPRRLFRNWRGDEGTCHRPHRFCTGRGWDDRAGGQCTG